MTTEEQTHFIDALAGLLGVTIGLLVAKQVVSRDEMITCIEAYSRSRPDNPATHFVTALAQQALGQGHN